MEDKDAGFRSRAVQPISMSDENRQSSRRSSEPSEAPRTNVGDRLAQFEQGQRKLWRLNYGLVALVTPAFIAAFWDARRSFAQRYKGLLMGVEDVVAVFMFYSWKLNPENT